MAFALEWRRGQGRHGRHGRLLAGNRGNQALSVLCRMYKNTVFDFHDAVCLKLLTGQDDLAQRESDFAVCKIRSKSLESQAIAYFSARLNAWESNQDFPIDVGQFFCVGAQLLVRWHADITLAEVRRSPCLQG